MLFCLFLAASCKPVSSRTEIEKENVFSGRLVRKYYHNQVPLAVEHAAFGWFLELDSESQSRLNISFKNLSSEDQQLYSRLGFNFSILQLCLSGENDRELCRRFENQSVVATGNLPKLPHVYRAIPSCQLYLQEMKLAEQQTSTNPTPEHSGENPITVSGSLHFRLYPGPPNYSSVENGDYPEGRWIVKMDLPSAKRVLKALDPESMQSNRDEITIGEGNQSEEWLLQHQKENIVCEGYVFPAETAHHHTPLLLDTYKISIQK